MAKTVDNNAVKSKQQRGSVSSGKVKYKKPDTPIFSEKFLSANSPESIESFDDFQISAEERDGLKEVFNDITEPFMELDEFLNACNYCLNPKLNEYLTEAFFQGQQGQKVFSEDQVVLSSMPKDSDCISPAQIEVHFPRYFEDEDKAAAKKFYALGVKRALEVVEARKINFDINAHDDTKNASESNVVPNTANHLSCLTQLMASLCRMFIKTSAPIVDQYADTPVNVVALRASQYFSEETRRNQSFTVPHLAYALGFASRKDMMDFMAVYEHSPIGYIIKRALTLVEGQRNIELVSGQGMMTGHKLDLETNFDWGKAKVPLVQNVNNTNVIAMNSAPPEMTIQEWMAAFIPGQSSVPELPEGDKAITPSFHDVVPLENDEK